jgi:crotonobetainyl-CoA:carnitine CoA-transferase CaiB-like acyl-CoA transferase
VSYQPLAGVKVLDLGILIPAALTSGKLAALGADVVKVEQPPAGDRIRAVPPFADDGHSPQHMGQNWGKRSIGLDVRDPDERQTIMGLARRADVIIENQLAGFWASQGVDFTALRRERPALIVCSVTGFGQTGPWAALPSHGLNMDALGDTLNIEWRDGQPHRGWTFTSWGNELGTAFAATAILAALLSARATGEGAWIDLSCWDALVESHRTEIALSTRTKQPVSMHQPRRQALYDTYLSSDGVPVLLGTLEPKFWARFCDGIGRSDLAGRHPGVALAFGDDDEDLRAELEQEFAKATAAEWLDRFLEWDVPGGPVLDVPRIMDTDHFAARRIAAGSDGEWPTIATAIRWHHVDERAGAGLAPPPAFDQHHNEILRDWLG